MITELRQLFSFLHPRMHLLSPDAVVALVLAYMGSPRTLRLLTENTIGIPPMEKGDDEARQRFLSIVLQRLWPLEDTNGDVVLETFWEHAASYARENAPFALFMQCATGLGAVTNSVARQPLACTEHIYIAYMTTNVRRRTLGADTIMKAARFCTTHSKDF